MAAMELDLCDHDAAYRVLQARDARFDGRLFVGVTSTGVYCRPICRVRTPKAANCRFFASAAQAEAQSFRPCMKCRPEISPGIGPMWSVMDASRTLAMQASRLLDDGLAHGDTPSIDALAKRLGVSERHLRRIFQAELGITPIQYLQTRRLLMAKQLLTDTQMPVSQVALASGFRSLRRFNDAFTQNYRMSPSRLRGDASGSDTTPSPDRIRVWLGYRAPYDIARMLDFLKQRAITHVEAVHDRDIRRVVRAGVLGPQAGWIEAAFVENRSQVALAFSPAWADASAAVIAAARRWLDLDASPGVIDDALHELPGEHGLRLPGSLDAFELAVRAVLGQQVTVAAARTLGRRLVVRFGTPIATPWRDVDRAFPSPAVFAGVDVARIAELGIIRSRAGAIIEIARAWSRIETLLRPDEPPGALIEALCALPGIGPWTAQYIAMRALSWPDAFPPGDIAVLKAMKRLYDTPTSRAAEQRALAFAPWRSYAVLRLWNSLEAA